MRGELNVTNYSSAIAPTTVPELVQSLHHQHLIIIIVVVIITVSLSISLTVGRPARTALRQADRAQLELFRSNACRAAVIDIGGGRRARSDSRTLDVHPDGPMHA